MFSNVRNQVSIFQVMYNSLVNSRQFIAQAIHQTGSIFGKSNI